MIAGLIVAGVGLLILVVASWRHGRQMVEGRPGVVSLELAGSGDRLLDLLTALKTDGRVRMRRALSIDSWIIAGYVPLLGGAAVLSIWVIRWAAGGGWAVVGTAIALVVAAAVVVAGVLDLVENAALAAALNAWVDPPVRQLPPDADNAAARQAHRRDMAAALHGPSVRATRAATAKFALLTASMAWLLLIATVAVTQALA